MPMDPVSSVKLAPTLLPPMKDAVSSTNKSNPTTSTAQTDNKNDFKVVDTLTKTAVQGNTETTKQDNTKKFDPSSLANQNMQNNPTTTTNTLNTKFTEQALNNPANLQGGGAAPTAQSSDKTLIAMKPKENPSDLREQRGGGNENTQDLMIKTQQNPSRLFPETADFSVKQRLARRGDEEEEDENGQKRRRRKPANFAQQRQPLTVIEGAKVSESQTQDMFVSSSHSANIANGRNKTTVEQLKEYSLGTVGNAVYETVIANTDQKEKNGIGQNMQKNIFTEILKGLATVEDVLTPGYKKLVREVVQGAMRAAQENNVGLKDMAKMIVSGLMAMSPHDDDPKIMAETVKTIVSEIIYGKINIGYNMKSASYYLGAALYTLTLYYKNYQSDVNFSRDLEQKLSTAFSESIWKSTGEISNYSQVYAKTNIEQFMAGRVDEEKAYQKNAMKGMLLSPIKKVLNK